MRVYLLRFVAVAAFVWVAPRLQAQSIAGRVVDHASGHPVAGTIVRLFPPRSGQPVATGQADSTGIFALFAPSGGRYRLEFGPPGHERQTVPELALGDTSHIEQVYRIALVAPSPAKLYFDFQVEQPATELQTITPTYPPQLQLHGVEVDVLVQFVVDTAGAVEPESFRVLEASHPDFTESVREALPVLRFQPARIGTVAVRQLVQQPFLFRSRR